MSTLPATTDASPVHIDRAAIMRALRLNPDSIQVQALILVCQRYGLDPLLGHAVLIEGKPYVTRDGYLAIAHDSGQFDGMEVIDEGETETHWWAKVAVHRKDMSRPFAYRGRYPKERLNRKNENVANVEYGEEMAVKVAEVASLRRAFNVTGAGAVDERWDTPPARHTPEWALPLVARMAELDPELREKVEERLAGQSLEPDLSNARQDGGWPEWIANLLDQAESAQARRLQTAPSEPEAAQEPLDESAVRETAPPEPTPRPGPDGEALCVDCDEVATDGPWCSTHAPF